MKLSRAVKVWVSSEGCVTTPPPRAQDEVVYLPAVHAVSGHQLQWGIFRRQLMSSLPRVCADFRVSLEEAQDKVIQLAGHFQ